MHDGEEKNDKKFAKELASLADIYVNEAFSVSHREHASVSAITEFIPSYAGFQFENEVKELAKVFQPEHPFIFILGGAKFETKLPLVDKFINIADKVGKKDLSWTDYYLRNVDIIDEMHDCARWVSQHYRVGLLSNIMPGFINLMISEGLLPSLPYASIIDSSVVGAIKPEPEIYRQAEVQSGTPARDILLVDDSRTNLMSAERMGWHVLWFDDFRPTESVSRIKSTLEF
jgi:hypothetical protein